MIIFPAIDIRGGRCVRLVQGKPENETVYSERPAEVARSFEDCGARWLHVVDLDGAFAGTPRNLAVIEEIAGQVSIPFQVGGGLRTIQDVEKVLSLGATRVIIGTRALQSPDFVRELLGRFGPERIVLGVDARDGLVAIQGWAEVSAVRALDLLQQMKGIGVTRAVYTDIAQDGLLKGPNFTAIEEAACQSGLKIIASGGVSSREDIQRLSSLGRLGVEGAIIGKAIYDGKVSLQEALWLARESETGEEDVSQADHPLPGRS